MSDILVALLILIGVILGWGAHAILLQVAYRLGIVEYKGFQKKDASASKENEND